MPVNKTMQLVVGTRPARNHSGLPQEAGVRTAWWRGREFPESLVLKTFSADLAPVLEEGRGWVLGYTLVRAREVGGVGVCAEEIVQQLVLETIVLDRRNFLPQVIHRGCVSMLIFNSGNTARLQVFHKERKEPLWLQQAAPWIIYIQM
jgi:hypothetical protein